jgi:hypothetical protein
MISKVQATPWNIAFTTSPKSQFFTVRIEYMSSQNQSSPLIFAFYNSTKSHFGTARRHKICSQVTRLPEASIFRPRRSRILWRSEDWKWFRWAKRTLETLFSKSTQVEFVHGQKAEKVIAMQGDHLRNLLLDLKHVVYFCLPEDGKWVRSLLL